jgi:hypothetical protein
MKPSLRALAVVVALASLAPREAHAMGAVIGSSGHPVSIGSVRVAVAAAAGRTTRWAQVNVTNDGSGFAWLVPVLPGARVDLGSDAWLDALDSATVPVVLPPQSPSSCVESLAPQVLAPGTSPSSRPPLQTFLALDSLSLASFVSGSGFEIPTGLVTGLGDVFASGSAVLALVYDAGELPVHTLRVLDSGPATLPFSLSSNATEDVSITAFSIAGGPRQAGTSPLTVAPGALVWFADGESSYQTEVASLIVAAGGKQWLTQSSEPSAFFQPTQIDRELALPAATSAYFSLAAAYGDTSSDPTACAEAAQATARSTSTYAAACPSGALAIVPGPSPCSLSSDATPVTDLVCGGAVDAALAVGELSPSSIWLTRIQGIVTASSAADVPLLDGGETLEGVVLTASSYDSNCGRGGSGASSAPDGGWGDDGGQGEGGEWAGSFGGDGGDPASDLASATSDGCGGSSTDPSSSSDGDDASSGSCGGDSSSADDSGGCSGGDSSGDSGGCSGDDPSFDDCSTARHRHRARSPVSRVLIVTALALGVVRRLRRPRPAARATK